MGWKSRIRRGKGFHKIRRERGTKRMYKIEYNKKSENLKSYLLIYLQR
jgi:hypothetical protein